MDKNLRRTGALIRDETRARRALDRHRANRFDLDAAHTVSLSVEALVETLGAIAHDEEFWEALGDPRHVPDAEELNALGWFDDDAFGAVLAACGYRSPPPPPVEDLVADTRDAIGYALTADPRPELVAQARRALILFLMRTRRQLELTARSSTAPDAAARRVLRVAQNTIPIVAGVAGGAALETVLPTGHWLGAGLVIGSRASALVETVVEKLGLKSAQEIATRTTKWAAAAAMGRALLDPPSDEDADMSTVVSADQAIAAHIALVHRQLARLSDTYVSARGGLLQDATQHLYRVIELAEDHDVKPALAGAARLALEILPWLEGPWMLTPHLECAVEAVKTCEAVRGTESKYRKPSYAAKSFGEQFDLGLDSDDHLHTLRLLRERWESETGQRARVAEEPARAKPSSSAWVLSDNQDRTDTQQGFHSH